MANVRVVADISEWQHNFLVNAVQVSIGVREQAWKAELEAGKMKHSEFAVAMMELRELQSKIKGEK